MDVYYIDRKTGKKEKEIIAGEKFLRWINETSIGKGLLESIVKKKVFSRFYGSMQDWRFSSKKIPNFIDNLGIDMSEAEIEDISNFNTFNDFFARKLKKEARPINFNKNTIVSPADGRVFGYHDIDMNKIIQVKGFHYSLHELFNDITLAKKYDGGSCIVVRLCPSDYHRFHFPDSGIPRESIKIKGHYYSVNPIALKHVERVYCQNKREITVFESENFDTIVLIEVGATCVGSIIQTYKPYEKVSKGAEKGYFKFGGSTVIMFIKKGYITIDDDIINNTNDGLETKVCMGESIGKR
ncbi:phosphatidylserine decarboxylase [Brassicibacter mesophilus]|uniref:phosphatidylserine decarboxylase n=1 Tax=Brassicibacter mesophilus TaxID=745119 RepID=UPI003D1DBD72